MVITTPKVYIKGDVLLLISGYILTEVNKMSIIQKLREFRKNHRIASAILDGAAAFTAMNAGAIALEELAKVETPIIQQANADYFDGCRGPEMFQLDQRLSLGETGLGNYTLLPKVFLDQNNDGTGVFGVTPFIYTPGHKPAAGAGAGMFFDLGKVKLLGVLPIVYNAEGEAVNINPTVYATIMAGKFLFDPRISYLASINEEGTAHNLSWGATVGLMLDNVVIGGDVETGFNPADAHAEQLRENLKYQGILRVDLDAQHKNWFQTYFGKDAVGIGFRANFK